MSSEVTTPNKGLTWRQVLIEAMKDNNEHEVDIIQADRYKMEDLDFLVSEDKPVSFLIKTANFAYMPLKYDNSEWIGSVALA
jgi:hypothetical protein